MTPSDSPRSSSSSGVSPLGSSVTSTENVEPGLSHHGPPYVQREGSTSADSNNWQRKLPTEVVLEKLVWEDKFYPTERQLCRVLEWINLKSLEYTAKENGNTGRDQPLSPKDLGKLLLKLTDRQDPDDNLFMELQLRTLIATISLLKLKKVTSFWGKQYRQLKDEIPRLWSDVFAVTRSQTKSHKDSDESVLLEIKIFRSWNSYLAQLADQYLSTFGKVDNKLQDSTGPLLDILFAGASMGGQNWGSSGQALAGIYNVYLISKDVKPKEHPICALHDHVRRATSLAISLYHEGGWNTNDEQELSNVFRNIFDKINVVFQEEYKDQIPQRLGSTSAGTGWRRGLRRSPPKFEKSYFFLGVLNCMVELAAFVDIEEQYEDLFDRLHHIIRQTSVEEFRWKAIEALLSHKRTRVSTRDELLKIYPKDRSSPKHPDIGTEITTIANMLERASSLRYEVARGITLTPSLSSNTLQSDDPVVQHGGASVFPRNVNGSEEGLELDVWQPTGTVSNSDSIRVVTLDKKKFTNVGFSESCHRVFFYTSKELRVFDTGSTLRGRPTEINLPMHLMPLGERIRYVRMAGKYLIVNFKYFKLDATSHRTLVFDLEDKKEVRRINGPSHDAKTIGVWEKEGKLTVFVAQFQSFQKAYDNEENKYNGSIIVSGDNLSPRQCHGLFLPELSVPDHQFVKHLTVAKSGHIIAGITNMNKVVVWRKQPGSSNFETDPYFQQMYGTYLMDTGRGITSLSIFHTETLSKQYALCTTWPSKNRSRSEGCEYPFLAKIPSLQENEAPDPARYMTQLENAISEGCVSNTANVFAAISKCPGSSKMKEQMVELQPGAENRQQYMEVKICNIEREGVEGINIAEGKPKGVGMYLQGADTHAQPCAIKFDPTGTCLWAADFEGRIYRTEFERSHNAE